MTLLRSLGVGMLVCASTLAAPAKLATSLCLSATNRL